MFNSLASFQNFSPRSGAPAIKQGAPAIKQGARADKQGALAIKNGLAAAKSRLQVVGAEGFSPFETAPSMADQCLLEAMATELHHMALVTAVAASGVNTFNGRLPLIKLASLTPYAAPDLALIESLSSMALDAMAGRTGLDALSGYLGAVADGRQAFHNCADELHFLGEVRAVVVHRRHLTDCWQQACRQAILALVEVEDVMAGSMPEAFLQNHKVLNGLLYSASQGFKPCVDTANQLFMPPLPQQRRWPRKSVLQTCVVTIGGKKSSAFIRDVSAGGLGLEHMTPVPRGTRLSICMESGRSLAGTIAWSRDKSAGLKFYTPLLPSDPLIRG